MPDGHHRAAARQTGNGRGAHSTISPRYRTAGTPFAMVCGKDMTLQLLPGHRVVELAVLHSRQERRDLGAAFGCAGSGSPGVACAGAAGATAGRRVRRIRPVAGRPGAACGTLPGSWRGGWRRAVRPGSLRWAKAPPVDHDGVVGSGQNGLRSQQRKLLPSPAAHCPASRETCAAAPHDAAIPTAPS
jgi:hypothetical protein